MISLSKMFAKVGCMLIVVTKLDDTMNVSPDFSSLSIFFLSPKESRFVQNILVQNLTATLPIVSVSFFKHLADRC